MSKERKGAARPTQGFQHCPQYVSHRICCGSSEASILPESHHSPLNCNSKHACADNRCSATLTEIEQWHGLQILRKIELWWASFTLTLFVPSKTLYLLLLKKKQKVVHTKHVKYIHIIYPPTYFGDRPPSSRSNNSNLYCLRAILTYFT